MLIARGLMLTTGLGNSARRHFSALAAESPERRSMLAFPRDVDGSKKSQKLRKSGWIPGVLYGNETTTKPQLIQVEAQELRRQLRLASGSFENQTMHLQVGDKTHLVLPRALQVHPASDRIMNITFIRYKDGMDVIIPLRPVNGDQSPAIRRGAFFLQVARQLKCSVASPDIPPILEVDLAGAPNKTVVRMDRVRLPPGIVPKLMNDSNFSVGTIVGKRLNP